MPTSVSKVDRVMIPSRDHTGDLPDDNELSTTVDKVGTKLIPGAPDVVGSIRRQRRHKIGRMLRRQSRAFLSDIGRSSNFASLTSDEIIEWLLQNPDFDPDYQFESITDDDMDELVVSLERRVYFPNNDVPGEATIVNRAWDGKKRRRFMEGRRRTGEKSYNTPFDYFLYGDTPIPKLEAHTTMETSTELNVQEVLQRSLNQLTEEKSGIDSTIENLLARKSKIEEDLLRVVAALEIWDNPLDKLEKQAKRKAKPPRKSYSAKRDGPTPIKIYKTRLTQEEREVRDVLKNLITDEAKRVGHEGITVPGITQLFGELINFRKGSDEVHDAMAELAIEKVIVKTSDTRRTTTGRGLGAFIWRHTNADRESETQEGDLSGSSAEPHQTAVAPPVEERRPLPDPSGVVSPSRGHRRSGATIAQKTKVRTSSKDINKQILEVMEGMGADLSYTGQGKVRVRMPGKMGQVIVAATSSDHRSMQNVKQNIFQTWGIRL